MYKWKKSMSLSRARQREAWVEARAEGGGGLLACRDKAAKESIAPFFSSSFLKILIGLLSFSSAVRGSYWNAFL